MLQGERLNWILERAKDQNFVSVENLAQVLDVSLMTIRRDLNTLCEQGLVERCYGGARLVQHTIPEVDYNIKKEKFIEEKKRIAKRAVEMIQENDTIYLDSGTTTGEVAKLLCHIPFHISVVTNELNIASILSDSDVELTILGGTVHKRTTSVIGHASEQLLRQFRFSKAFVGTSSIDYNFDSFSPTYDKIFLKRLVMELSSQIYLLTDSSKFYCQAMCKVCSLGEFTGVITDKKFNESEQKRLAELGIQIFAV